MSNCEICGEPMPESEEMFKFHGFSGPCPKPPKPRPSVEVLVEYVHRQADDEKLWLDIRVNRQPYGELGPFETIAERQRAQDDLLGSMRALGSVDLPLYPQ